MLAFGKSVDAGVNAAGVVVTPAEIAAIPVPVLGVGVLEGEVAEGFTLKEFKELGGIPGVGAAGVAGFKAGKGGAAMSVFHSRIVYKVASSMCGSMMI